MSPDSRVFFLMTPDKSGEAHDLFGAELSEYIRESENEWTHEAPSAIQEFLTFAESEVPQRYEWSWIPPDQFENRRGDALPDIRQANSLYWDDMLSHLWAYLHITIYKGHELTESIVDSLRKERVIVAAGCARTLLENAVVFTLEISKIRRTLENILGDEFDFSKDLVVVQELEETLSKLTHGTRDQEWKQVEGNPQQTNFLTYKKKVDRAAEKLGEEEDFSWLLSTYSRLCEYAHPNLGSNLVFFSGERYDASQEKMVWNIEREPSMTGIEEHLDAILPPTHWSSQAIRIRGSELTQTIHAFSNELRE